MISRSPDAEITLIAATGSIGNNHIRGIVHRVRIGRPRRNCRDKGRARVRSIGSGNNVNDCTAPACQIGEHGSDRSDLKPPDPTSQLRKVVSPGNVVDNTTLVAVRGPVIRYRKRRRHCLADGVTGFGAPDPTRTTSAKAVPVWSSAKRQAPLSVRHHSAVASGIVHDKQTPGAIRVLRTGNDQCGLSGSVRARGSRP